MDNHADQAFKSSSFPTESLSPSGESVSRFREGCTRIKMTYFNNEYAKVFVAFIGLLIVDAQENNFLIQVEDSEFGSHHQLVLTFAAATLSVLSGVLSCIYPAQNMLLISIFITSVLHIANRVFFDMFKERLDSNFFWYMCRDMMFVTALPAFHGIWASLIQLHKSSVFHVPIVLYAMYVINNQGTISYTNLIEYSSYRLAMISLVWCAVWAYMIFKPNTEPTYKTIDFSVARTLSNIPWKPMFTSMPVLAILVSYTCESFNLVFPYMWMDISSKTNVFFRFSFYKLMNTSLAYITMIITIAVLEFYPDVIRNTPTIHVRKFWSSAYFLSQAVFYYICSFTEETVIDNLIFVIFDIIEVLYAFGFIINHLDIAPRYASIMCGIITALKYIVQGFVVFLFQIAKDHLKDDHRFLIAVQVAVVLINLSALAFYYVFASAEIQPWAKTHEEQSHQESDTTAILVD